MKKVIFIILISSLLISNLGMAHSGRTDKNGCHRDKSTNTRHCH
ncbi:YHYH domain-containing protein [Entomomonas asaccharolytica]|uniref:YHYH domain-containing protein n=1 Tax=Entomomonas asaccharolytica TaxID=2785331 RepID=A0A974NES2_9GAMM|nr:YHYH domain-containing protein [Entomomonas asaccharolytica]